MLGVQHSKFTCESNAANQVSHHCVMDAATSSGGQRSRRRRPLQRDGSSECPASQSNLTPDWLSEELESDGA